eukprot:IDg3447t1
MADTAHKEVSRLMGSLRISRALRNAIPAAADISYEPGDKKKLVQIQDAPDSLPRPFNVTQVHKYYEPEELSRMHFTELHQTLQHFSSNEVEENLQTFLTEIIDTKDPRSTFVAMIEAKQNEICGLLDRGTFKLILREDVPPDANILPGRF